MARRLHGSALYSAGDVVAVVSIFVKQVQWRHSCRLNRGVGGKPVRQHLKVIVAIVDGCESGHHVAALQPLKSAHRDVIDRENADLPRQAESHAGHFDRS